MGAWVLGALHTQRGFLPSIEVRIGKHGMCLAGLACTFCCCVSDVRAIRYSPLYRFRPKPLRRTRFVADVHLAKRDLGLNKRKSLTRGESLRSLGRVYSVGNQRGGVSRCRIIRRQVQR
jgi:hypothetical protein